MDDSAINKRLTNTLEGVILSRDTITVRDTSYLPSLQKTLT